jgi:hypothetical protein
MMLTTTMMMMKGELQDPRGRATRDSTTQPSKICFGRDCNPDHTSQADFGRQ